MSVDLQHVLLSAIAAGLGLLACGPARAQTPDWQDLESRIQYGYYTEDVRSVQGVIQMLAPAAPDALKSYYAGLANYRLALLSGPNDRHRTKEAAANCVDSLDHALELRKDFADALALQSACLDVLATLEPLRAPFAASRSGSQIEKARHLEPKNPRVLLLGAVSDYQRVKATPAQRQQARSELQRAAESFEAERQDINHVPGWGTADVYLYIARCRLDDGNALAARDALERALLIAPEFMQARRLMKTITSG
ncbi:MAG TPA: hypothetical protein VIY54_08765 [Steroidobacteraceae bacterium]